MSENLANRPHVVIIGGGFGGLNAAIRLGKANFDVTILDKQNFHLFQPLLYQIATGFLTPGDIASPLRAALANYKTVRAVQDEVLDIKVENNEVIAAHGIYKYDVLIVAAGMRTSYFGHDNWSGYARGLKTIEDSINLRSKILSAFETAERTSDEIVRKRLLTFAIIGGGPTGVELAGALSELSRRTLIDEFRNFNPADCKIVLFEGGSKLLPSFHESISDYTLRSLKKLNVEVYTDTSVTNLGEDYIEAVRGEENIRLEANTIIWAAGVRASALSNTLKDRAKAELDKMGRVKVTANLSLPYYPNVYVIGDLAHLADINGKTLPGLAPVAMQQGKYVAKLLNDKLKGKNTAPFSYVDKGNMAVIGKSRAVAESAGFRLTGFPAWVIWALVHIFFLIEFENKFIVFFRWGWNYLTNNRGSRLITQNKQSP